MEMNGFCFLKGFVNCPSWIIQDCNIKRVSACFLENDKTLKEQEEIKEQEEVKEQPVLRYRKAEEEYCNTFCFLKGMVACHSGVIQDCNTKRVTTCQLEKK